MKHLILIFSMATAIASCTTTRYASDYLHDRPTSNFQTYNIEGECEKGTNRLLEVRVTDALTNYLDSRGYKKSDHPDRLIQFFIKETQESFLSRECDYYSRWLRGGNCSAKVLTYKEGSIVVDVINTNTNSIIWHGVMYRPTFEKLKKPQERINGYVENLMNRFFTDYGINNNRTAIISK